VLVLAVGATACLPSPYVPPHDDAETDAGDDEALLPSAPGETSAPETDVGGAPDAAPVAIPPPDGGGADPARVSPTDGGGADPARVSPTDGVQPAQPAQPLRILVLGDSITHGDDGDFTWRFRLHEHLRTSGVAFDFVGPHTGPFKGSYARSDWDSDHASVWGDSATDELPKIAGLMAAYRPQLLIVELGINDLVFEKLDATQAVATLGKLIDAARTANPGLKVVTSQIERSQTLDAVLWEDFNTRLGAWVSTATRAEAPVVVAAVADAFAWSTDSRDGTHPNVRGEYIYAKAIADVLHSALGIGEAFGAIPLPPPPPLPRSVVLSPSSVALNQPFTATVTPGDGAEDGLAYQLQLRNAFAFGYAQVWASPFVTSLQITYAGPAIPSAGVYDVAIAVRDREGQVRLGAPVPIEAHP
jgi:lysophospholipase L1-like esterase